MTAFVRSWLVMASVALLSSWSWAQAPQYAGSAPQFDGFAPGWGVPLNFGHAQPSSQPIGRSELLPNSRTPWDNVDDFVDLGIRDFVASSWVRAEYLHANFQHPGNTLLGAPSAVVPNLRQPFLISAGDVLDARAIVPDTSRLTLNAQSGVRTTIGINAFKDFQIVGSYVGMQDMRSSFRLIPGGIVSPGTDVTIFDPNLFPNNARFIATSVLDSGVPGSRVILYDRSFEAAMKATYWSGDVNVLFNYHMPDTGFRFQPLAGFRYTAYDEDLVQHGEFDNSSGVSSTLGTLTTPTRNTILSTTQNLMTMGQVGFQAELADKWFTVGVAPKIGFGSNSIHTHVMTDDLRDSTIDELANDGVTNSNQSKVIFATNLDLNAYMKLRLNPWLSLTGSAFYWYMPNVARADKTIIYNDNGIDAVPAIRTRIRTNGLGVHGFTVGAEITF